MKALTLGADAVGIVTLLVIAVAADGHEGVRTMMELLNEELQRTMSYVGFRALLNSMDRLYAVRQASVAVG